MSYARHALRWGVKVYARGSEQPPELEPYIGIFHRWIQKQELAQEMMIDVADYRHVPHGPGVMLICHGGHYALDSADGQLGLLYRHKRATAASEAGSTGAPRTGLRAACIATLRAAQWLEREREPAQLRFGSDRLQLHVEDRLLAPNDTATFAALRPEIEALAIQLYSSVPPRIEHLAHDPRAPFTVTLSVDAASAPTLDTLLAHAED